MVDNADTAIATIVKSQVVAQGGSPLPSGKFWPAFLKITDIECEKVKESKFSVSMEMWHLFFTVVWHNFSAPDFWRRSSELTGASFAFSRHTAQ